MYLILGSGVAAVRASGALRAAGFEGPVRMISPETELPYDKPPLSKDVLRGPLPLDHTLLEPESYYIDKQIDLLLGERAVQLEPAARRVHLASGLSLTYERLLVATGAAPRRLTARGSELAGVVYLRTAQDARALSAALEHASRVLVVGAGLLGLEIAASARQRSKAVALVEGSPTLLGRLQVGETVASALAALHADHGIMVWIACTVEALLGTGHVEEVVLSNGLRLPVDLVVVAIGVRPETDWLEGSGIELDDGGVVNKTAETTIPGVFAAGDVARTPVPRYGRQVRLEQYGNAHEQGIVTGRAMAGAVLPYRPLPGASSEQFGMRLQIAGLLDGAEHTVVQGDLARFSFVVFFLRNRTLIGAVAINRPRDMVAAKKLVATGPSEDALHLVQVA